MFLIYLKDYLLIAKDGKQNNDTIRANAQLVAITEFVRIIKISKTVWGNINDDDIKFKLL